MTSKETVNASRSVRPKGESLVWFTGLGLSVGVILIVALLFVIVKNGLEVFWPDTIREVRLAEGSDAGPAGGADFAAAIKVAREKRLREPDAPEATRAWEYQFFTGNKRTYGAMYHFVDADKIRGGDTGGLSELPVAEGIARLERDEYGDAIGYPRAIVMKGGDRMEQTEDGFREMLQTSIREANERRETYTRLEKNEIGSINRDIREIRVERDYMLEQRGPSAKETEKWARLQSEMDRLQAEYEKLATRARALREKQDDRKLEFRLHTGETREIPFGNIRKAYFPNEMTFPDKIGFFFAEMWKFVSTPPREANTQGGIFPAIFGTFVMTLIMSIAVMPFGVIAAIYLREYATQGVLVRAVRISVNNLAGVPSIVYGVFGLGFFVYIMGGTIDQLFFEKRLPTPTFGTGGILWASLTLALMTVPVVIVATEEALAAVPRGMREASLACGASKWQTIQRIILPASAPGILTGLILAMARGAGEVAPLMLVGVVKLAPSLPVDGEFPFVHLERKFMHLGFHIYDLGFQSPDADAAKPMVFATTLFLIVLVIGLNVGAILIRNHLRRKYRGDTF